jgi:ribosomal-protein-alanine N-acetyltransferase
LTTLDESDLAAIIAIEERAYRRPWSERMFRGEFANALGMRFGWREEECLVGYVFGWLLFDDLHINNIAVDPDCQGRGIGAALLDAIMAKAFEAGGRKALLEVRPSNERAQRLYTSRGFIEVHRRIGYYDDTSEDAIVLYCRMDARNE